MTNCSFHNRAATRLVMADSAGNQTLLRPFYYDLHTGDGTSYRFRAKDATDGRLGSFVSRTDAHGKTVTLADMGVDIVSGVATRKIFLKAENDPYNFLFGQARMKSSSYDIEGKNHGGVYPR